METIQEFMEKQGTDEDEVVCPTCRTKAARCESHILGLTALSADDDYVSNGYVQITSLKKIAFSPIHILIPNRNRNLSFIVHFECESEGPWNRYYAFHKGATTTTDRVGSIKGMPNQWNTG